MKKLLSIALAALMILSIIPLSIAAVTTTTDSIVLYPNELAATHAALTSYGYSIDGEQNDPYLHLYNRAGAFGNDTYTITIAASKLGINMLDYPYVKVGYRTNSDYGYLNTNVKVSTGKDWPSPHPTQTRDESWHDIVVDITTCTSQGVFNASTADGTSMSVILNPFKGGGNKTYSNDGDYYYDIKYIAFFKTDLAANSYSHSYNQSADSGVGKVVKYAPLTSTLEDEILSGADALIEEILNTPNNSYSPTGSGKTYYVSTSGSSSGSGTSQSAPITLDRLKTLLSNKSIPAGSVILFKRGDTFRTNGTIKPTVSGLTLAAYGEGAKPRLYNSVAGEGEGNWERTETKHVWKFAAQTFLKGNDIGNIVFNGGEGWGIKVCKYNKETDLRVDIGRVFNGYESYMSGGNPVSDDGNNFSPYKDSTPFIDQSDLSNNLEFYHNWDDNYLYLYYDKGNPGKVFDSIEIARGGHLLYAGGGEAQNLTIDNLAFAHTGSHGIGIQNSSDCTIKNCTFEWIGGSLQYPERYEDTGASDSASSGRTRLGNAVENWGSCQNYVIDHCYATQIYDCCFTTQYSIGYSDEITDDNATILMKNISITNTVSSYSNSGPEVWLTNSSQNANTENCTWTLQNLEATSNYVLYGGYGWGHQRYNKDSNFFYGATQNDSVTNFINCEYHDNYFFKARHTGIKSRYAKNVREGMQNGGYNFRDNTFVMAEGLTLVQTGSNLADCTGNNTWYKYDQPTITQLLQNGFFTGSDFYYYNLEDSRECALEIVDLGEDVYYAYPYDPDYNDTPISDLEYKVIIASDLATAGLGTNYSTTVNTIPVEYRTFTSEITVPLSSMNTFSSIVVKDYPFIKVGYMSTDTAITSPATLKYKTNFAKKTSILGSSTTSTEAIFSGPTLAVNVSGKREKSVADIKATTNDHDKVAQSSGWVPAVEYSWDAIENDAVYKELIIDPWNGGSASNGRVYGISYIAFFKSDLAASQFSYPTRVGDANDDLKVDMVDEILMSRYFAGIKGFSTLPSFLGANANNDEFVSPADHTIVARYLAGWTKYATLPYAE